MNTVDASDHHAAASQESASAFSDFSQTGSLVNAAGFQSSASNLSTATGPDTDLTSPASSIGLKPAEASDAHREAVMAAAMQLNHVQTDGIGRARTPEPLMINNGQLANAGIGAPSPMAVDTPYLQQLHQASKRTASGTVKPLSSEVSAAVLSPSMAGFGHSRSISAVDGANRKKISELSAQLKTRLSYAMVKVQHGWENRSLDELEQSMAPASSAPARIPMTPTSTNRTSHHSTRPSVSSVRTAKGYGAPYTERANRYAHSPEAYGARSPDSQPAMLRRRISSSSGDDGHVRNSPQTYASFWAQHERNPVPGSNSMRHHAHNGSTSTVTSTAPSLAPAADLVPSSSKRRSQHGRAPPQLSAAGHGTPKGQLTSPRTPRQNLLRMPSQQAEKDAVDTLLFMSSPNNSGNLKHFSQQGSPLRGEFPAGVKG